MADIILDENEDWEKRILCSDESCIGTIGPDGTCKECGMAYDGELPSDFKSKKVEKKTSANKKQEPVDEEKVDDWDKRVLCGDESCIGVIGPDGTCKECGKPL